jgi:mitochondrial import receptor subunit TOM20
MSVSTRSTWSIITIAGVTIASGVLAYAVYFDYKRRNDTEFRKQLRTCARHQCPSSLVNFNFLIGKDKKRVQKATAESTIKISEAEFRAAIAKIRAEEVPEIGPEREAYFMQHVGLGEQLCAQGACSNFTDSWRCCVQG